ncbi:MAG TPA: M10 family metallopeptidase C-terminal domain-containing protein [Sphingomonas sp.]|uniref:M10 family metallopeptidase C-terminal domain-containing protein n=1 Tax=Sphingomonas sp. TaxID=28214 RepID=UPI002C7C7C03|nr:M10 family metallopeptidase C-terminal domain-containing protein [Sphingomonas sp.]HMI18618.1 M10 family metallopeptidase C-terminal domain-containing protein [Sphingomonas sp.]
MSNTDALSFAPDALVRGGSETSSDGSVKTSLPAQQAADHIAAYAWGGHSGQPLTITYAYRETGQIPDDTASGFSVFSSAQIAGAEKSLVAWSDVANIHFQRVDDGTGYSDNATILLGNFASGPAAGETYFPGSRAAVSEDGDVWINGSLSYDQAPTIGNYGGQVLIHEIGHALGLNHPSDYDASDDTAPTYSANASYFEDSRQYSVMSYFDETETGGNYGSKYSAVPLLDDISAIQELYGANLSAFTGDTVYGFNSNTGREWFSVATSSTTPVFAVWDAGGNDTFDFSGYSQSQLIDLRAGDFSNVGGLHDNVAIAYGATIENAIGGSGSDEIVGNAVANLLTGGSGQDTMSGEGGNDALNGGLGNDQLDGGSGSDTLDGGDGNDKLLGSPGVGPAGSGAESDYYMGGAGADTITGGTGNDHIYGNELTSVAGTTDGADSLSGGDGNDYLQGNAGADRLDGGNGNDRIYGGADNDTIEGSAGNDYLQGNKGADSLSGSADQDTIHGGADNDTLSGGAGLDQLFGDAGNDRFVFAAGDAAFATSGSAAYATDHIMDFGNGADVIALGFHVLGVLTGSAASVADAYASATALLSGHAADVAAVAVGTETMLFYHADGSAGTPDSAIALDGVNSATIVLADFV